MKPSQAWTARVTSAGAVNSQSIDLTRTPIAEDRVLAAEQVVERRDADAPGRGVKQDFAEAARWYRTAADRGHALAQFNLGNLYEAGQGMPKDTTEAAKWYRKAADQGEPKAEHALGLCYADGDGVPQDLVEAYKWISLAATRGHAPALEFKETLEKKLTPEQKAKAQQLANTVLEHPAPPQN